MAQRACRGFCLVYMFIQINESLRRTLCAAPEEPPWLSKLCTVSFTFQRLQRLDPPFLRMLMRRMPSTCSAYRLSRLPLACAHHMMSLHSCADKCQHKHNIKLPQQRPPHDTCAGTGCKRVSEVLTGSLQEAEKKP